MILRVTLIVATLAVAGLAWAPPRAHAAGLTTVRSYDVPRPGERSLAATRAVTPFDLVGAHWRGPGSVEVRVRAGAGEWGAWQPLDAVDGPDAGSPEGSRSGGWRVGEGLWVGRSTAFQVRARGEVRKMRVFTVRSPVSKMPLRRVTMAGQPAVVMRSQWLADETLRRNDPTYAPALRFAVVHHTAGPNSYSREAAPAVVRAIMAYHVQANGWSDIGYNALVDRFGTVYEGRYGGLDKNVVGAHALGFNTGSFGIAVLGTFERSDPPAAALDGLATTLAWRLDLAHVDPLASLQVVSGGSERFAAGTTVTMRAISGHRDSGSTACPGDRLYARLPALARRVAGIGLPKIYDPALTGALGGPVTLTARLSTATAWSASLLAADGAVVDSAAGTGSAISVTWDTSTLAPGAYTWRIDVAGATPASGVVAGSGPAAPVSLQKVTSTAGVISPDGDGTLDTTTITYVLSSNATVGAVVVDLSGTQVAELEPPRWRRAGERQLVFDGLGLPDGLYVIRLEARAADGTVASVDVPVTISRTLGAAALATTVFTPNGDGRGDTLDIRFELRAPAGVRVRIVRADGRWVATPFTTTLEIGPQVLAWDGTKNGGAFREGSYVAVLEVTDTLGTATVELPFIADWTAPRLRLASRAPPILRVSEPARLLVVVNGLWRRLDVAAAGAVRLPWVREVRTLRVVATDRAGNRTELRIPAVQ